MTARLAALLLTAAILSTAVPASPQSSVVLFEEDFRTSRRLKEGKGKYCHTRFAADAYIVRNIGQSGTCTYWLGFSAPDNVRIEMAFRLLQGDVDSGVGFAFGRDGDLMYAAMVSVNEAPAVRLSYSPGPDWVTLVPGGQDWWKDSGVARGHGALNRLAVELRGRAIRVLLNGRFVFETTSPHATTGRIGFHVDLPDQEVAYEYVRVINLAP